MLKGCVSDEKMERDQGDVIMIEDQKGMLMVLVSNQMIMLVLRRVHYSSNLQSTPVDAFPKMDSAFSLRHALALPGRRVTLRVRLSRWRSISRNPTPDG